MLHAVLIERGLSYKDKGTGGGLGTRTDGGARLHIAHSAYIHTDCTCSRSWASNRTYASLLARWGPAERGARHAHAKREIRAGSHAPHASHKGNSKHLMVYATACIRI